MALQEERAGLSLNAYVRHRLGRPMGAPGLLQAMGRRAFGARSFARFWYYWNPIFGYALGRFVFTPARRIAPRWLALLATFLICGAIHDGVTWVVRGSTAGLFTGWFLFLAIGVLIGEMMRMDLSRWTLPARASAHVGYVIAALGGGVTLSRMIAG